MDTKKLMATFAILTIALGIAGYAYASWYTYLYIEGTVNTGELSVAWSIGEAWDTEPENKDFSHIEGEIVGNTLCVSVCNAYPCIDYYLEIDIENTGTIPVHVYFGELTGKFPGTVKIEGLPEAAPLQLHPGEAWYGTIHVHLDQEAEQGETYTFSMEVLVIQWNMLPEQP
ncbi:MAG: hypothetical protein QXU45_00935 [Candidatus Bathyarchaeia archaeon]